MYSQRRYQRIKKNGTHRKGKVKLFHERMDVRFKTFYDCYFIVNDSVFVSVQCLDLLAFLCEGCIFAVDLNSRNRQCANIAKIWPTRTFSHFTVTNETATFLLFKSFLVNATSELVFVVQLAFKNVPELGHRLAQPVVVRPQTSLFQHLWFESKNTL